MIHITFAPTKPDIRLQVNDTLLRNAAQATLDFLDQPADVDLAIVVSDDARLRELNRTYLGIDKPTDVLTFASGETDPDSGRLYLGDVIISYARAVAQAQAASYSLNFELQLLVVHGVLHILGYDHAEEQDKKRMWSIQSEILSRLDLPDEVIASIDSKTA
jgi:probable rRNA maturation factor